MAACMGRARRAAQPLRLGVTQTTSDDATAPLVLAVANAWPPMPAGTGRALRGMLGERPNTVVLAPRAADPGSSGGAQVLRRLWFAHRARGPFKIHSLLQHAEIIAAPIGWCGT